MKGHGKRDAESHEDDHDDRSNEESDKELEHRIGEFFGSRAT